ncbi:RNA polymerase sigma factor [Steroidobacter sp.]|uniref:RNA polymerase sigma factor n=1 Tax=Steroidobacter sp. TaxID=1978227 RepID=UPI001A39B35B|nr:RNA polymerase sigma factor [Steroidobacter sp.]MBL8270182.1 RNA polymerase sigma factor [Steroidobacter sp.]
MDKPDPPQDTTHTYQLHREQLRVFFQGLARQTHDAEDMLQEVYVRLARHPPSEPLRDPVAYLFRVAWSVLKRSYRHARRRPVAHDPNSIETLLVDHAADVSDEVIAEEALLTCLKQLPPIYGAVFYLRRRDGLEYAAIAKELNISLPQVRRYLGRALAHLKTHLAD